MNTSQNKYHYHYVSALQKVPTLNPNITFLTPCKTELFPVLNKSNFFKTISSLIIKCTTSKDVCLIAVMLSQIHLSENKYKAADLNREMQPIYWINSLIVSRNNAHSTVQHKTPCSR